MAIETAPLINLTYLKTFVNIRAGNTDFDTRLQSLINVATTQIEEHTHRRFTSQTFVELFNARQTIESGIDLFGNSESGLVTRVQEQILRLEGHPLDTGQSIEVRVDHDRDFQDVSILLNNQGDDYFVDGDRDRILLRVGTHKSVNTIKVTYTAGFAKNVETPNNLNDSADEQLRLACALQTMFLWRKIREDNIGVGQDRQEGATKAANFLVNSGITPEAATLLVKFRRTVLGKF